MPDNKDNIVIKFVKENAAQIGLTGGGSLAGALAGAKIGAGIGIATGGIAMAATVPLGIAAGAICGLTGNRIGLEVDKYRKRKNDK